MKKNKIITIDCKMSPSSKMLFDRVKNLYDVTKQECNKNKEEINFIIGCKALQNTINRINYLEDWLSKGYKINDIFYEWFWKTNLIDIYNFSDNFKVLKTKIDEANPFWIWCYEFDRLKHPDFLPGEKERLVKTLNLLGDDIILGIQILFPMFFKDEFDNTKLTQEQNFKMFNWLMGRNKKSKGYNDDLKIFNLKEMFILPMYKQKYFDSFWVDEIKPFFQFVVNLDYKKFHKNIPFLWKLYKETIKPVVTKNK